MICICNYLGIIIAITYNTSVPRPITGQNFSKNPQNVACSSNNKNQGMNTLGSKVSVVRTRSAPRSALSSFVVCTLCLCDVVSGLFVYKLQAPAVASKHVECSMPPIERRETTTDDDTARCAFRAGPLPQYNMYIHTSLGCVPNAQRTPVPSLAHSCPRPSSYIGERSFERSLLIIFKFMWRFSRQKMLKRS
jgi:hypothetical protein